MGGIIQWFSCRPLFVAHGISNETERGAGECPHRPVGQARPERATVARRGVDLRELVAVVRLVPHHSNSSYADGEYHAVPG